MQEKLEKLFNQCINELKSIGLNVSKENVGDIKIQISKRNNKNWNWNVSYDGEPISYEFKTTKTKLIINNVDNFDEAALGYIALSQYKSNKKIKIWLRHKTCEETEIDNIEEAD